jgi:hypothetical protein
MQVVHSHSKFPFTKLLYTVRYTECRWPKSWQVLICEWFRITHVWTFIDVKLTSSLLIMFVWSYSECASTPSKLKRLPDRGREFDSHLGTIDFSLSFPWGYTLSSCSSNKINIIILFTREYNTNTQKSIKSTCFV